MHLTPLEGTGLVEEPLEKYDFPHHLPIPSWAKVFYVWYSYAFVASFAYLSNGSDLFSYGTDHFSHGSDMILYVLRINSWTKFNLFWCARMRLFWRVWSRTMRPLASCKHIHSTDPTDPADPAEPLLPAIQTTRTRGAADSSNFGFPVHWTF
jgi:hypothetical protein